MTLDQIIDQLESDGVEHITNTIVLWIKGTTSWFITPFGGWLLGWILRPFIKLIVGKTVEIFDLGAYYLYKAKKNPKDAEKYQDAVRETKKANESGDKDAIRKAREEQKRLFAIAVVLSK